MPFAREPMDAFTDQEVEIVVIMSNTQMLKTEVFLNVLGAFTDDDPCPMMVVTSTIELAKAFSKDRLAPMIRDCPSLASKIEDEFSNNPDSTVLHKKFPGGHITITGSNSPDSLASRPIRILLCDEVDRYPASAGKEGDPINLAMKRTSTFYNRKIGISSSPGTKGQSRIVEAYEDTDQRRYLVPCPECEFMQFLTWKNLKYDKDADGLGIPSTAAYCCEHCGTLIDESQKSEMVDAGEWKAQAPFNGKAGFWINELYSPWTTWSDMVVAWNEVLRHPENIELLRVFVNTRLAETFEERGEAPEWTRLHNRREKYTKGIVPPGGLVITAGVDVQADRLECEVVAWGRSLESWSIDYHVVPGKHNNPKTWASLDEAIFKEYEHANGGRLRLRLAAVDTGYATNDAYTWARRHGDGRVMAVKGVDRVNNVVGVPGLVDIDLDGKKIKNGVTLWPVGSSFAKRELYSWLRLDLDRDALVNAGFLHFPDYPEDFFLQLTAEEVRRKKNRSGYYTYSFVKTRERNEALDCRIYSRAAAACLGLDRLVDRDWLVLDKQAAGLLKPKVRKKSGATSHRI